MSTCPFKFFWYIIILCKADIEYVVESTVLSLSLQSPGPPLWCIQCSKSFKSIEGFRMHLSRHQGVFPYTCNHCGKSFSASVNLTDHMRQHTGERLQCALCGSSFRSSGGYKGHMRNVHKWAGCVQKLFSFMSINYGFTEGLIMCSPQSF